VEGESVNRALRRWHLRLVAGLAPVAVVTLTAAVLVRKTAPDNPTPVPFKAPPAASLRELDRRLVRAAGLTVELRRLVDSATGSAVLELVPLGEPHVSDPLVYWPDSGGAAVFLYSGATRSILARIDLTPRETPEP
jgi:hypothetical protein